MGVITVRQAIFRNRPRAADAFGDVLPGHLDMNPAGIAALGLVHLEELLHLAKNLCKVAGLVAAAGLDGVAVHRVRTPQHLLALALYRTNQVGQVVADLAGAHARNQVEAAWVVVRVEDVDQADQVLRFHARADLDPDRVVDPAQELDVGAVQLPRAVADPEHVRRAVVIVVGQAVAAYEGLFIVQQQRFVGGEEAGFAQLWRAVHAAGAHERQGFVDAVGQLAVLFGQRGVSNKVQVPLVYLVQVGKPALGKRAQQIQGGSGLMVGLQQAVRVRHTAFFVEADAVDDVATVGGQGDAVDGFIVGRAWLGELAGHASDLDHRATGGEGHHNRHLQQHLEGVADFCGGEFGKALGAVAALQQESAALGHFGKLTAQLAGFPGKHQRRVAGQVLLHLQQVRSVRVLGLLLDRQGAPAVGAPGLAHHELDRLIDGRAPMLAAISA